MSENIKDYRHLFARDSEEFISGLNTLFVNLESDKDNLELIQESFRLIHSLKSEASYLNLTDIADCAHGVESILEDLRTGKDKLSQEKMDNLFALLDNLQYCVRNNPPSDYSDYRNKTGSAGEPETLESPSAGSIIPIAFTDFENQLLEEARLRGERFYRLVCEIDESAPMKFAKAYLVLNNLEQLVTVIRISPSLEKASEQELGRLEIYFTTLTPEKDIYGAIALDQVEKVQLAELSYKTFLGGLGKTDHPFHPFPKPAAVSVKVGLGKLDSLLREVDALRFQLFSLKGGIIEKEHPEILKGLFLSAKSLEEFARSMRMVPLEEELIKLHRFVRDLSVKLNKKARFILNCSALEADRGIIELLFEPLVHLIRNAMDHGIEPEAERIKKGKPEQGTIYLTAECSRGLLTISVKDDGAGIDRENVIETARLKGLAEDIDYSDILPFLIHHGFSTKPSVSELSGRGVGLDLVNQRVKQIAGGSLSLKTQKESGTEFIITVPASTLMGIILVRCGDKTLGVPKRSVDSLIEIIPADYSRDEEGLLYYQGLPVYSIYGRVAAKESLPKEAFALKTGRSAKEGFLLVDDFLFEQDIPEDSLEIIKEEMPFFYKIALHGRDAEFLLFNPAFII